jgi:hypothetical protein
VTRAPARVLAVGSCASAGRQSVVLVSDNNFSPGQVTQLLLLAM